MIASLAVYPIKSCRGVALDEAEITRRGLAFDRLWMVVDERGRFLSQRDERGLVSVATRFDGDAIVASAPGAADLGIPRRADGARMDVEVWGYRVPAVRHEAGSAWFSAVLGRRVLLVHMPDDVERRVSEKYGRPDDVVSFADGYPIHLTTEESLADVAARVGGPLGMDRFRPNVVVRSAARPYDEDAWRRVAMGGAAARVLKRCGRCVMTTLDPATGASGPEPLRTLAGYRTDAGSVYFGVYLAPDDPGAVVRVGDRLEVLERAAPGEPG
jgi:uncharacterized protein YcbX